MLWSTSRRAAAAARRRDLEPQNPSAMGIAASSSHPEPAGASVPSSVPTTEPVAASTPPAENTAPPPVKDDAAVGAGAGDGTTEKVVVDVAAEAGKEGEEEEEGECGFCLFMKGGGCKEEFVAWEKCVEDAEASGKKDDVVDLCYGATAALRKCMDAHADYYEPILRAERAMAEDLEAAQAREASGSEPAPSSSPDAPGPAPTSEEEGQKKQAAVANSDDKEKGAHAA